MVGRVNFGAVCSRGDVLRCFVDNLVSRVCVVSVPTELEVPIRTGAASVGQVCTGVPVSSTVGDSWGRWLVTGGQSTNEWPFGHNGLPWRHDTGRHKLRLLSSASMKHEVCVCVCVFG